MKKLALYIALLLGCASCDKFLDVKPTNVLAVSSYDDVKALLGSHLRMHTGIPQAGTDLAGTSIPWRYRGSQSDLYLFWGFYCDDLDTDNWMQNNNNYAINKRVLLTNSLNWQNPNMPGVIWNAYFSNIGFYNTIIDELVNTEASQAEKDIVEQEARVLRAWNLFKVLQYFSPYHNNELGIPYNTDSQAVGNYDKSRKTQTQVYEYLIKELNLVLECPTEARSSYNIFYDKRIANALLAQIYHFKGGSGAKAESDYDHAITHAKAAMGEQKIQSIEEFKPFFTEKIGGVRKGEPQALLVDISYITDMQYCTGSGNSATSRYVKNDLVNLYSENDIRKSIFFGVFKPAPTVTMNTIKKFSGLTTYYHAYNFFSFAEMHLIIAESYARSGKTPEAKQWLEDFQRNRIKNYSGFAGEDVLVEIMNERRKEFCLESDMRWCDLIRTQKGWTRKSYQDKENPTYTLKDNDYRFCLPIPLEELDKNAAIDQNPGWSML